MAFLYNLVMSSKRDQVRKSKFLSLVLRHRPDKIGLQLDAAGWAEIEDLLAKAAAANVSISRSELDVIVAENNKQRFIISDNGRRIRANQGHSINVDLGLEPCTPPDVLYHGTAVRFLESILAQGLCKQNRQHVHLSGDWETAVAVGKRHGKPVVLQVLAGKMAEAGHLFYFSENHVWLTDHVPPHYLETLST